MRVITALLLHGRRRLQRGHVAGRFAGVDNGPPCTYTPLDCTGGDKCKSPACDPSTGCAGTPVNCDDGNACSVG